MKSSIDNGYKALGLAVVKQAAMDYKKATRILQKYEKATAEGKILTEKEEEKIRVCKAMVKDCEKFMRSEECYGYCGANPTWILENIKKEITEAHPVDNPPDSHSDTDFER